MSWVSLSPVMKITGTWASILLCLSARQVSKPSMLGITASIRMTSGVIFVDDRERLGAFERDQHRHAGLLERVGQHAQRVRQIVDDQYDVARVPSAHDGYVAPPGPSKSGSD